MGPNQAGNTIFQMVTIRDSKHLCNVLDFAFSCLSASGALEVNPVDLIALEIVRIHFPQIYSAIRDNEQLFVTPPPDPLGLPPSGKEDKTRFEELVGEVKEPRLTPLKAALAYLFPKIDHLVNGVFPDGKSSVNISTQDDWYHKLRVCHSLYFQKVLSVQELRR